MGLVNYEAGRRAADVRADVRNGRQKREILILIGLSAVTAVGAMLLASPNAKADTDGATCATQTLGVCGPMNTDGVTPGCYNFQTGELVVPWPCATVIDSDGWVSVFSLTRS